MNRIKYLLFLALLLIGRCGFAQTGISAAADHQLATHRLTIEPGIGIHTNFGTDLLFTNLVQWNMSKHFSIASHASFNVNNITQRYFNGIKTGYNFSLNQKFGVGTTWYGQKRSHTFLLMLGVRYTTYRETLEDDRFEDTGVSISDISPDYGLMYSLKSNWKKYFFTCRVYAPLYPWPIKSSDLLYLDGNINNIALEFGVGIRIL